MILKFRFALLEKTFCISVSGVKHWNTLEGTLRKCPNMTVKNIKKLLILDIEIMSV